MLSVLSLLVGGLGALLWVNLVHLPAYEVRADGRAVISAQGLASLIAGDAAFVLLGLAGGVLLGGIAWSWFRQVGWWVALIAAGAALLAGVTCWWLGTLVGPGPFDVRLAEARPGDVVPVSLGLRAPSALAVWPFAAVAVPLFAASLGADVRQVTRWRARKPAASEGEPGPD